MSSDQKKIALQYFEGDDRIDAALDIVNEWSYQIQKTYKKRNNHNSTEAKFLLGAFQFLQMKHKIKSNCTNKHFLKVFNKYRKREVIF